VESPDSAVEAKDNKPKKRDPDGEQKQQTSKSSDIPSTSPRKAETEIEGKGDNKQDKPSAKIETKDSENLEQPPKKKKTEVEPEKQHENKEPEKELKQAPTKDNVDNKKLTEPILIPKDDSISEDDEIPEPAYTKTQAAKMYCIINYFESAISAIPKGEVIFSRKTFFGPTPIFHKSPRKLINIAFSDKPLEEHLDVTQVYATPKSLGSSTFENRDFVIPGEAMALSHPELLLLPLFVTDLMKKEWVEVAYLLPFSKTTVDKDGRNFSFVGPVESVPKTLPTVLLLPPVTVESNEVQLSKFNIQCDLNKLYRIMHYGSAPASLAFSTWGGEQMFQADLQVKALLWLLAASCQGEESKEPELVMTAEFPHFKRFKELLDHLRTQGVNSADLYVALLQRLKVQTEETKDDKHHGDKKDGNKDKKDDKHHGDKKDGNKDKKDDKHLGDKKDGNKEKKDPKAKEKDLDEGDIFAKVYNRFKKKWKKELERVQKQKEKEQKARDKMMKQRQKEQEKRMKKIQAQQEKERRKDKRGDPSDDSSGGEV